jgi:hypothetical protein
MTGEYWKRGRPVISKEEKDAGLIIAEYLTG